MKRRRSERCRLWIGTGLLPTLLASTAPAQGDVAVEGAIFLLRPVGARAVGLGQATAARQDGSESIWWNPAALASVTRKEVAIHHSQDFFATGDAIALVLPSALLGVVGLAADIQDYGEQENTVGEGLPPTGTILSRSFVLSASYATAPARNVRLGVAFKVVQLRVDCTGPCDLPTSVAQTFAIDGGMQHDIGSGRQITLGASVRNLGVPLQVEDSPQADPLPSRLQVGVSYRPSLPERFREDAELSLSADVVDDLHLKSPLPRLGAEFVWQGRASVRGGYVFEPRSSESGGPALGLGFVTGTVHIDIGRMFTGFSADAGQAPTYLSLRIQF